MSKMFKTHQNTIGNVIIALLFVGGCIFLLTGSWDTSVSEAAKGCCGGDTTATLVDGGSCGSTNKVSEAAGNPDCKCIAGKENGDSNHDNDAKCGLCDISYCGGSNTDAKGCASDCTGDSGCGPEGTKCNLAFIICNLSDDRTFCQGDSTGCTN